MEKIPLCYASEGQPHQQCNSIASPLSFTSTGVPKLTLRSKSSSLCRRLTFLHTSLSGCRAIWCNEFTHGSVSNTLQYVLQPPLHRKLHEYSEWEDRTERHTGNEIRDTVPIDFDPLINTTCLECDPQFSAASHSHSTAIQRQNLSQLQQQQQLHNSAATIHSTLSHTRSG